MHLLEYRACLLLRDIVLRRKLRRTPEVIGAMAMESRNKDRLPKHHRDRDRVNIPLVLPQIQEHPKLHTLNPEITVSM